MHEQVKQVFCEEAERAFQQVRRIPSKSLPKGCQLEHIELWELSQKRQISEE
jgi:hypothetical protein